MITFIIIDIQSLCTCQVNNAEMAPKLADGMANGVGTYQEQFYLVLH